MGCQRKGHGWGGIPIAIGYSNLGVGICIAPSLGQRVRWLMLGTVSKGQEKRKYLMCVCGGGGSIVISVQPGMLLRACGLCTAHVWAPLYCSHGIGASLDFRSIKSCSQAQRWLYIRIRGLCSYWHRCTKPVNWLQKNTSEAARTLGITTHLLLTALISL